ncbi:tumor suppressor candidate 2 [Macrotis lagotis]|uniref:tumor suppressor candidate 2 n=1 Tax=Macrotis lagotis TaxID=92651 RepID=UPI003D68A61C
MPGFLTSRGFPLVLPFESTAPATNGRRRRAERKSSGAPPEVKCLPLSPRESASVRSLRSAVRRGASGCSADPDMGTSGSKGRGLWPFSAPAAAAAAGPGGSPELNEAARAQHALARARGFRTAPPFVFTRRGSMYYDEDGDLAHEFYEETIVTKNGRKRAKLRRVQKNLIPQGIVRLDHPRLHVDFPVIICEM